MKLICAHKLSECLNFVSLFITPSKGVLPYNSVCLGLPRWSAQFFCQFSGEKCSFLNVRFRVLKNPKPFLLFFFSFPSPFFYEQHILEYASSSSSSKE